MAHKAYSAKNCKVKFGAIFIAVKEWNVDPVVDHLESTNSESGGNYEGEFGTQKCTVTITLDDNGLANLFDLSIKPGTRYSLVKLFQNDTTGPFWSFANIDILSIPQKANVKELVGNTINAVGIGAWVYPTGNAL